MSEFHYDFIPDISPTYHTYPQMPPRRGKPRPVVKPKEGDVDTLTTSVQSNLTISNGASDIVADAYNPLDLIVFSQPDKFVIPKVSHEEASAKDSTLEKRINYQSDKFSFGISNIEGDMCGRRVIATKPIKAGETLLVEHPTLWIPSNELSSSVCHCCANRLHKLTDGNKPLQHGFGIVTYPTIRDATGVGYYCSDVCSLATSHYLKHEANLLPHMQRISADVGFDLNLLKLCVRYLILKYLIATGTELSMVKGPAQINPKGYVPKLEDTEGMVPHYSFINAEDTKAVAAACASALWPMFPSPFRLWLTNHFEGGVATTPARAPPAEFSAFLVTIAGKFNANIFQLTFGDTAGTEFGIGVFPLGAHFNHSCIPNCVFVNEKSCLVLRALAPIPVGEELRVNYCPLDMAPASRAVTLVTEKDFECQCNRCAKTPMTQSEANAIRIDALLGGVRVNPLSEADAKLIDPVEAFNTIFQRDVKGKSKPVLTPSGLPRMVLGKTALFLDTTGVKRMGQTEDVIEVSTTPEDESGSAKEEARPIWTKNFETTLMNRTYRASNSTDDSPVEKKLSELQKTVAKVEKEVQRAFNVFAANDTHTIVEKRAVVEKTLLMCYRYLSPCHEFVLQLLAVACNIANRQQDHHARLKYASAVVEIADIILPANFLSTANYYQALHDAQKKVWAVTNADTTIPPLKRRQMCTTLAAECRKTLEKEMKIIETCLGKEHSRYLVAQDKLAKL